VSRTLAAALVALAALSASAAPLRTAGKILKAQARISPSADGPVFREGRVTILDKADHVEEFKATKRTKVTLDGKPAKFQKAAVAGALVLKALYDPSTKELSSLDLKSGPKPDADDPVAAGTTVRGEIAHTDVIKGIVSVRSADKSVREFVVPEAAKITREVEGKPGAEIPLEALQVGDSVEVFPADARTAREIHVRAAR
jgi:hypothetical protein